jgi:hypothetical protein
MKNVIKFFAFIGGLVVFTLACNKTYSTAQPVAQEAKTVQRTKTNGEGTREAIEKAKEIKRQKQLSREVGSRVHTAEQVPVDSL